jgi:hypothetical protein
MGLGRKVRTTYGGGRTSSLTYCIVFYSKEVFCEAEWEGE